MAGSSCLVQRSGGGGWIGASSARLLPDGSPTLASANVASLSRRSAKAPLRFFGLLLGGDWITVAGFTSTENSGPRDGLLAAKAGLVA